MDFDPQRKGFFVSGSGRMCQISSKLVQNCDHDSTDRQTHTYIHTYMHTYIHRDHTSDLIICAMLCYSNGTDLIITLYRYKYGYRRYVSHIGRELRLNDWLIDVTMTSRKFINILGYTHSNNMHNYSLIRIVRIFDDITYVHLVT